jgi:NTP pyrophosphatase (non-canonical NTP hydrolase)
LQLNAYQDGALKTAIYPKGLSAITYIGLKLSGEAGEFAEHLGKAIRDDNYLDTKEFTQERKSLLVKELGDVLWYVAAGAKELGCTLSEIAEINLLKLSNRKGRGVLGGSGDNR